MNTDEFYLIVASSDSQMYFGDNKLDHFTYKLPKALELDSTWKVALCEIIHPVLTGSIEISCDLVRERIYGDRLVPLLAQVPDLGPVEETLARKSYQIEHPVYCHLAPTLLSQIKFNVKISDQSVVALIPHSELVLILHFKQFMDDTTPIILKSDTSTIVFPSNSPAAFKNELPHDYYFDKDMYEVALIGLSFISTHGKVRNGYLSFVFDEKVVTPPSPIPYAYETTMTKREFTEVLNNAITRWKAAKPELAIEVPEYQTVKSGNEIFVAPMGPSRLTINNEAFHYEFALDKETLAWFNRGPEFVRVSCELVKVACSIVEPTIVGNNIERILRLVCINREKNGSFSIYPENPYYVPMSESLIRVITIELKDRHDKQIELGSGHTIVHLNVRKRYQ